MKAVPILDYAFVLNNGVFYANLELDERNRVVKTMFTHASEQQEQEVRKILKGS